MALCISIFTCNISFLMSSHLFYSYPLSRKLLLASEPYDGLATPYNVLRGLKVLGSDKDSDLVSLVALKPVYLLSASPSLSLTSPPLPSPSPSPSPLPYLLPLSPPLPPSPFLLTVQGECLWLCSVPHRHFKPSQFILCFFNCGGSRQFVCSKSAAEKIRDRVFLGTESGDGAHDGGSLPCHIDQN